MLRTLGIGCTLIRLNTSGGNVSNHSGRAAAFVRSEFVEADHWGWADWHCCVATFVDIGTALRCLDEALGAGALAVQAELAALAVVVDVAAGLAELVDTDLALEAVLVRVAELQADAAVALLASGAVGVQRAAWQAVASVAEKSSWANFSWSTEFRDSNAALSGSWNSCKAGWALTGFSLVQGSADGVRTTGASH